MSVRGFSDDESLTTVELDADVEQRWKLLNAEKTLTFQAAVFGDVAAGKTALLLRLRAEMARPDDYVTMGVPWSAGAGAGRGGGGGKAGADDTLWPPSDTRFPTIITSSTVCVTRDSVKGIMRRMSTTIGADFVALRGARPPPATQAPGPPAPKQAVHIRVWDTAGAETFRSITRAYFRQDLAIAVYDPARPGTAASLRTSWVPAIREVCGERACRLLVVANARTERFVPNLAPARGDAPAGSGAPESYEELSERGLADGRALAAELGAAHVVCDPWTGGGWGELWSAMCGTLLAGAACGEVVPSEWTAADRVDVASSRTPKCFSRGKGCVIA